MKKDKSYLQDAINYLNRFQLHGFRLGLERMHAILKALGEPHKLYPSIHVAGTNGKGSVCAAIASILQASGYKTGLYTSPHLVSLAERFQINGRMIEDEDLARMIFRIKNLVEAGYELSYFEYTTAISMEWFAENRVDIAVFETGLGGRLDATNVISPLVAVITTIGIDHQKYLGQSIREIANEKAGIIKSGVDVVSGIPSNSEAGRIISDRCRRLGVTRFERGRDFRITLDEQGRINYSGICLGIKGLKHKLKGRHQADNLSLALATCELLTRKGFNINRSHMVKGCDNLAWPGRGERIQFEGRDVFIDGAHNLDGVKALKGLLTDMAGSRDSNSTWILLWACSNEGKDKDFTQMLEEVTSFFDTIIITEPPGPRHPVTIEEWEKHLKGLVGVRFERDWDRALAYCLDTCREKTDLLCVAGSLYLVGAVRGKLTHMPKGPSNL